MARPKNQAPVYKLHTTTGLARCWVGGKWVSLGKYGSTESRAEFARVCAEHATGAPVTAARPSPALLTVDQLILRFLDHAKLHYRGPEGQATEEVRECKRSLLYVHELYGAVPAADFGPLALAAVRQKMIRAGWCRTLINRRVDRVKRAFKWGTSQEIIPPATHMALKTLPGLQRGRTEARESKPVKPVTVEVVEATLKCANAQIRGMVLVQLYTGMRPGEVCAMSLDQIDCDGDVWVYRPRQHKTLHRDKGRAIVFGPKARAVLAEFMATRTLNHSLPIFSPRAADQERRAAQRAARRRDWGKKSPATKRKIAAPRDTYSTIVYGSNVRRAAKAAGVAPWAPNQLRHAFATMVRKLHGLEAAQVLLGHSRADVTQVYAEKNLALALQVAAAVG